MKSRFLQTSFASGEIMPEMFGRGDLQSYDNGAKVLQNVNVLSTGGVRRRAGSKYISTVSGTARLFGITINRVAYMTIWRINKVEIYQGTTKKTEVATPFSHITTLEKLFFAPDTDGVWICSGTHPVCKLSGKGSNWTVTTPKFIGLEKAVFTNGYPIAMGFIQGRTVLAGTTAHPNRIWMSRSGKPLDFALNKGLDDDGIDMVLLSSGNNTITGLFCGLDLMVFTTAGEWIVSGNPITPASVVARQHTRVGSPETRCIPIMDVDGLVLFVARTQNAIYAYSLDGSGGGTYKTQPMASMARHIIRGITDMAHSPKHNRLLCVKSDGKMAVLTFDKAEGLSAWSHYTTNGAYTAVATNPDGIYTLVKRHGQYMLEVFDRTALLDSVYTKTADKTSFDKISGLMRFNNTTISLIADGIVGNRQRVTNNTLSLPYATKVCHMGYAYTHIIQSLPLPSGIADKKIRLRKITLRLQDTASAHLRIGDTNIDLGFRAFGTEVLNKPVALFSGDKTVTTLGWKTHGNKSIWHIQGATPLPITVLSVKLEVSINQ